ncbi:hypothetical protein DXN05_14715 [Deminuibacter soli]|uniref:Uncharacterized protein n=1 Tax=Deminuibacter soli TaxID=2291815 RepID=A0A3E1NH50_9BACT|nr:hypothetical protein DXN05_14715 [Deminuibacter soli]
MARYTDASHASYMVSAATRLWVKLWEGSLCKNGLVYRMKPLPANVSGDNEMGLPAAGTVFLKKSRLNFV